MRTSGTAAAVGRWLRIGLALVLPFLWIALASAQPPFNRMMPVATPTETITEEAEEFEIRPREGWIRPTLFYSAAMSPDGQWLAFGTSDWTQPGGVTLIQRGELADKKKPGSRVVRYFPAGVRDVAFSLDNRLFAAAVFTNQVWILDLTTMKTVALWKPHNGAVNGLAFSPDNRRLATASLDKTVSVWDLTPPAKADDGLTLFAKLEGHTESVYTTAFSADGRSLFSAGRDRKVIVWDVDEKKQAGAWEELPAAVEHLVVSPDGNAVALGLWNGKVEIRKREDGTVLQRLDHLPREGWTVCRLAFSPYGEQLASVATDGQLKLWNRNDGSLNQSWTVEGNRCWAVQYIKDGQQLLTAGADGVLKIWDRKAEQLVEQIQEKSGLLETTSPLTAAAWSSRGMSFATAHLDNSLRLRRVTNGTAYGEVRDLPEALRSLAYSPVSPQVAGAGEGSQIYLIDVSAFRDPTPGALSTPGNVPSTPVPPLVLSGHTGPVRQIVYAADGSSLFSVSDDGTVRHWDAFTGVPGPTRKSKEEAFQALACSADGRWLAAGGKSGTILVWDLKTGSLAPAVAISTQQGAISSIALSPDGKQLASSGADNSIRLWTLPSGDNSKQFAQLDQSASRLLVGREQPTTMLAFSPLGTWLAADGAGESLHLWKTATGEATAVRAGTAKPLAVHFDPSGKGVGRLGADGQWQTWGGTYARIKPIAKLELADGVRFLAFTPDQSQAIVGTLTATIHAWDLQLGKVTKAHCSEGIADGALSADGKTLATIGFSGDVALWSLQPLKVVATLKRREALKAGENEGTAIAVSADGTRLATGSWDGLITVWDVPNRKELLQLPKQELPVECLGFSPDGQRLVSTTGTWKDWKVPGAIRVWDVTSGKELATLPGPKGTIRTAAFSRDGKTLIAGGSQNELLRFVESEGGWQEQPAVSTAGDNAAAAFIGDGADTVFSATSFGTASVWTFQPRGRRECLSPLTATAKAVDAVAVTTDGSLLAMGTSGGEVLFFVTPGAAPSSSGFQLAKRNIPGRVAPYVAKP